MRTFKRSTAPHFAAKPDDEMGLYMASPRHAVVLSVDGRSQIQVLDRTQPELPLEPEPVRDLHARLSPFLFTMMVEDGPMPRL